MALPEVTEKQHFRFKVPLWQVRGKTFLGMGRDEETAVFCITEAAAESHAGADPANATAVRRMDARSSFLGLEVRLADIRPELLQELVREAWTAQAPSTLVKSREGDPPYSDP
ncbi:MAG: MmcQ/YjbR family DNA-binding protein [Blastococcus sp.]